MAVTEEVSLTAVPAKRAKPSLEDGAKNLESEDKSCQDNLKKKITENGLGYFFSLA